MIIGTDKKEVASMFESAMNVISRRVAVDTGPVLVMTEIQPDGNYITVSQVAMKQKYTSDFFANQPDGEFPLFISQGSVRSRDFPKEEKTRFQNNCCRAFEAMRDFKGHAKLFIQNGEVAQVRFEPVK